MTPIPYNQVFILGLTLILCFVIRISGINYEGRVLINFLKPCSASECGRMGWNESDADPCAWEGIACSAAGSKRVMSVNISGVNLQGTTLSPEFPSSLSALLALTLSSVNLSGSIPAELGLCWQLQLLDLSGNNLSGSLPPELGRLRNLEELHLQSNNIRGHIPAALGDCAALRWLTLHDNQLSGTIPADLGRLQNLEILRAGGNSLLSGSLPPELSACSKLQVLGFASTSVSGPIPPEYGALVNLVTLSLYSANLSGNIPPELGNCSKLQNLYAYQNHIGGLLPKELAKAWLLSSILLWQNNLIGPIPSEFGLLCNLVEFDLSENLLSGSIPASLGNLSSLQKLYFSNNSLSSLIPPSLGNCSSLTDLQLDRNRLSGKIPDELGFLPMLTQILLWDNSLEGSIPSTLGNCSSLESLDLSLNHLSGTVPRELFQLRFLEKLLLVSNNLVGEIPSSLRECSSLVRFRIAYNSFSGKLPCEELGQLQKLAFLDFSYNRLLGAIDASISGCRSLQFLNLHQNQISGNLPEELGHLSLLQVLEVSDNCISGVIPSTLGNLRLLNRLSLNRNRFFGPIPDRLGNCMKLQLLDLSSNFLSGNIPPTIGRIESLTIALNLSWNSLSGSLPQELSGLANLGTLDLSHNNLSGSLDPIGGLGQLVTLNVSFNSFSGILPDTYFFKMLPAMDYQGNSALFADFNSSRVVEGGQDSSSSRVSGGLLGWIVFGGAASMLCVFCVLLYFLVLRKETLPRFHFNMDSTVEWPWQMIAFQKLNFSLHDVLHRLVESNIIGQGCSGVVYKVEMPGGEVVAVKRLAVINKSSNKNRHYHDAFSTEIQILGSIRHLNIVRLLGYCSDQDTKLLMYDFMCNGSLGEILHVRRRMLDWETRYNILLGAAQGLAYLHHDCVPPILHRDVKSNNILLGPQFEPYLADFGLAKLINKEHNNNTVSHTFLAGSYGYIAPEYGYTLNITDKSDVFSFGVVMLEMLTGRWPVDPSLGEEEEGLHIADWVRRHLQRKRHFSYPNRLGSTATNNSHCHPRHHHHHHQQYRNPPTRHNIPEYQPQTNAVAITRVMMMMQQEEEEEEEDEELEDQIESVLDPRLQGLADHYMKEMAQVMGLALDCCHPLPDERPTMRHVVTLLVSMKTDQQCNSNKSESMSKSTEYSSCSPKYEALSTAFCNFSTFSYPTNPPG